MLDSVLPLYRLSSGCDYHRIILPLGYMGYDFTLLNNMTTEKLRSFKVIAFNRVPFNMKIDTLKNLQSEFGIKIWMDLDDYWILNPEHYLYKEWNRLANKEKIEYFMGVADVITCTTERLASKIRPFNNNVIVIPNGLPFKAGGQYSYQKTDTEKTRFGYIGGASHTHDLRSIAPLFQHYNMLNFTLAGYTDKNPEFIKMRDICSNNMKNPNFKLIEQLPLDKYLRSYSSIDCCIAPLTNVEFNKYKSNLKVLEAGLKKCAIICSPNPCFTDTVPDSVVTYCSTIRDWKEAIKKHQDLDYTKERGEQLHNWVYQNYELEEINKRRESLLKDLIYKP